jgi:hypothetical protein
MLSVITFTARRLLGGTLYAAWYRRANQTRVAAVLYELLLKTHSRTADR